MLVPQPRGHSHEHLSLRCSPGHLAVPHSRLRGTARMAYEELIPLARSLGDIAFQGGLDYVATLQGVEVRYELLVDSGTVVGCVVSAELASGLDANQHLALTLRRETRDDVHDKHRGQTVELQLGVPAFDDAVFIDTNASEAEARRVLATPERRQAVLRLIEQAAPVSFTGDRVSAKLHTRNHTRLFDARLLTEVGSSLAPLAAVGQLEGPAQPRRGRWLETLGLVAVITGGFALFASAHVSGSALLAPLGAGTLGALSAWLALAPLIGTLTAGDSGSGQRSRRVRGLLALAVGLWLGTGLLGFNAALDDAAMQRESGQVLERAAAEDDDGDWTTTVSWADGRHERLSLKDKLEVGQRVERRWHPGLFLRWGETVSRAP